MACCSYSCPVLGCDEYQSDNLFGVHLCPTHQVPMIRDWDERGHDDCDQEEHEDEYD